MTVYQHNSHNDVVTVSGAKPASSTQVSTSQGNLVRASATLTDPNMVKLANGMTTTRAAAEAAGIAVADAQAGTVLDRDTAALQARLAVGDAKQAAEDAKIQAIHNDANVALDLIEAELTREEIGNWTEAVIAMEDDALDAVPDSIFNSYVTHAETIARGVGLENLDAMSALLDDEDQAIARRAIITNDVGTFQRMVQRTLQEATALGDNLQFQEELRSNDIQVRDNSVNINGTWMPIAKAILAGYIVADEGDDE